MPEWNDTEIEIDVNICLIDVLFIHTSTFTFIQSPNSLDAVLFELVGSAQHIAFNERILC